MNTILEKAIEVNADAIGLSALSGLDEQTDADLSRRARRPRVDVSGHHRRRRDQPRFRAPHRAAAGRRALLRTRRILRARRVRRARARRRAHQRSAEAIGSPRANEARSASPSASGAPRCRPRACRRFQRSKADLAPVPVPPFWGVRTLEEIDFDELWPCFDLRSLYRLSWGAANTKGEAFEELVRRSSNRGWRAIKRKRGANG